jgi:secondary thiamine-phosphate synthase enzyme
MQILTKHIDLETTEKIEFLNITNQIKNIIAKSRIKNGIVNIYSQHTTTAIRINENEPLLIKDIKGFLEKKAPSTLCYNHDNIDNRKDCPDDEPRNAHSHLKSFLLGTSETIPLLNKQLPLGKWQSIFFVELDGPRKRKIIVHIIGI